MKIVKIKDCNQNEHFLNVDFIYNITTVKNRSGEIITNIHLNHKDDDYSFSTFKTNEPLNSLLERLEEYK